MNRLTKLSAFRYAAMFAVAAMAAGAAYGQAAELHLSLTYVGSIDETYFPIGMPLVDDPGSVTPSQYHQFNVSFAITGAAANEDIQSLLFDALLGPGFTPADFGGYIGDPPILDPPSPWPGIGPFYPIDEDGGADPNDLKEITVVANAIAAHRFRPGILASGYMGNIYVQWDGSYGPDGMTSLALAPNGPNSWGLYVGTTSVFQPTSSFFVGDPFIIAAEVPEPSTVALVGLVLAGLTELTRRRL